MRILLVNPPSFSDYEGERHYLKAGSRWAFSAATRGQMTSLFYPFWLGYATALIKRQAYAEARLLDCVAAETGRQDFLAAVQRYRPNLLLYESHTVSADDDLPLMIRAAEENACRLAACGPHPSGYGPLRFLEENARLDFVLFGEYENTAALLARALAAGREPSSVPGLAWRRGKKAVRNRAAPLIGNLDSLPYPERDDAPIEKYRERFATRHPCLQLITSRGCPSGCIFCLERWAIYNSPRVRFRSAHSVVNEMLYLKQRYQPRSFYFDDMSFTINKRHVLAICRLMRKRGVNLPWACMGDVIYGMDREMLETMRAAGCAGIKFGIESADPAILRRAGKRLDPARAGSAVEWMRKIGLKSHATYLLGLPGDSVESIKRTVRFAAELPTDSVQFAIASPLPGTPFYKMAEKEGWLTSRDWHRFDGACFSPLSYPGLSGEQIEDALSYGYTTWALNNPRRSLPLVLRYFFRQRGLGGILSALKGKFRFGKARS